MKEEFNLVVEGAEWKKLQDEAYPKVSKKAKTNTKICFINRYPPLLPYQYNIYNLNLKTFFYK